MASLQSNDTQPPGFEHAKSDFQKTFLRDVDSKVQRFNNSSSTKDKIERFGAILQQSTELTNPYGMGKNYLGTIFRPTTYALGEVADAIRNHLSQPVPKLTPMQGEPCYSTATCAGLSSRDRENVSARFDILTFDLAALQDERKSIQERFKVGISMLQTACGAEEFRRDAAMTKVEELRVQHLNGAEARKFLFGYAALVLIKMAECLSEKFNKWEVQLWGHVVPGTGGGETECPD